MSADLNFAMVPHTAPAGFVEHRYRKTFVVDQPRAKVWGWLNDPATFVDGQVWPYFVEFVSVDGNPPGFYEGGINTHHGPFINFAGMMTEIREEEYRDLQYFYGSYFLNARIVRPTRLQFWVEDHADGQTKVTLQLDSLVAGWFRPMWQMGQQFFWGGFPRWMRRSLG